MRERTKSTRCVRQRLMSFAVLTLVALSSAHGAITQVTVRTSNTDSRLVADVAFDAPVCLASQEPGVLPLFQPPASSLLQSRVDGTTVSIVLDVSAPTASCINSSALTIVLPPVAPGSYTLRVADSRYRLSGILYGNRVVQVATSTTFTVPASALPTPIPVFQQQGRLGTELTTNDGGAYQYAPTYASDTGRWQPVFYAWPWGSFVANAAELRRVFTLATRIPNLSERYFHTIDVQERNALVATGRFVDVGAGSNAAVFAAIAPASARPVASPLTGRSSQKL